MCKLLSTQLFLNLHLNFDFKISPWFLSEYLTLELKWRLNLPLRRNFLHSSKWQLEKCSWKNACFLDQKLTSKRCVEVRLLHALKKLILTIMELIILKKIETFFFNFKSMSRLRKPEKPPPTKNKFLPQSSLEKFCELLANINIKHKLWLGSVYFRRK